MGCFRCFGSSSKEVSSSNYGVQEVSKKESSKEGSGPSAQSNSNVNRVSSGNVI